MSGRPETQLRWLGVMLVLTALLAAMPARAEQSQLGAAKVAAAAADAWRDYDTGRLDAAFARLAPIPRDRTLDRWDRFSAAYLLSRLIERGGRNELLTAVNDDLIAMDAEESERFRPSGPLIGHNVAQHYLAAGQPEEAYRASSPWLGLISPLADDPDLAGLYLALLADSAKALAVMQRWEDAEFVLERGIASLAMSAKATPADAFTFFEAVGLNRMIAGLAHDARQVFAGLHRIAEKHLPAASPDRIRVALWYGYTLADIGEAARSTEILNGVIAAVRGNPALPSQWRDLATLVVAFNQVGAGSLGDAERTLAALADTKVALYRTLGETLRTEIGLMRQDQQPVAGLRDAARRMASERSLDPSRGAYALYLAALADERAGRPAEAVRLVAALLGKLGEQDLKQAEAGSTHVVPPTALERRVLEQSLRLIIGRNGARPAKLEGEAARLAFDIVQRLARQRAALGVSTASFRTAGVSALDQEQLRAWELLNHRRRGLVDEFAAMIAEREQGRPAAELSTEDRWRRIAQLVLYHDKLLKVRTSLAARLPDYLARTRFAQIGLDDFRAALGGDEAAVFLVPNGGGVLSACVSRDGLWLAPGTTPKTEIIASIERLRHDLTAARPPDAEADSRYDTATAHWLYRALFGALAPCLETASHVIQVLDAELMLLPTAALTTTPHRGAGLADAPWFARKYAVSLLPSAASLGLLRSARPASQARQAFLGFGDPDLSGADRPGPVLDVSALYATRGGVNLDELRQLGKLPETAEELRALSKLLGAPAGHVRLGAAATERALRRETLTDFRILAFATHGLLAREIDGLSEPAIVLTSGDRKSRLDDGLLTTTDIGELRLDAELVILSACNTAGSDGRADARGLTGLAHAFFGAGARSLIATQWSVDSAATRDMMIGLVGSAAQPGSRGIAFSLRDAALKMIATRDKPYLAHPRFWAPLIVAGDGRALAGVTPATPAPSGVRLVRDWEIVEGGPRLDEAMRVDLAADGTLMVAGVEGVSAGSRRAGTFHWRVSPDGRVLSRRTMGDLGFAANGLALPGGDTVRMGTIYSANSMTDAVIYRERPDGARLWSVIERSPLHETPGEIIGTPRGTILAIMTRNRFTEAEAGSEAVVLLELDESGRLRQRREITLPLCTVSDRDCAHRRSTPLGHEPTAAFLAGAYFGRDGHLRLVLRIEGWHPPATGDGRDVNPISGHRPRCGLAVRTAIWELDDDLGKVRKATLHDNLWINSVVKPPGGDPWLAGSRYAECSTDGDVFAAPLDDSGALGGAVVDGTALNEAATSVALSPRREILVAGRATVTLEIAQRGRSGGAGNDPGAERDERIASEGAALLLLYSDQAHLVASLAAPGRRLIRIRDTRFLDDDRFVIVGTIDGGQVWIAAYRIDRLAGR